MGFQCRFIPKQFSTSPTEVSGDDAPDLQTLLGLLPVPDLALIGYLYTTGETGPHVFTGVLPLPLSSL